MLRRRFILKKKNFVCNNYGYDAAIYLFTYLLHFHSQLLLKYDSWQIFCFLERKTYHFFLLNGSFSYRFTWKMGNMGHNYILQRKIFSNKHFDLFKSNICANFILLFLYSRFLFDLRKLGSFGQRQCKSVWIRAPGNSNL